MLDLAVLAVVAPLATPFPHPSAPIVQDRDPYGRRFDSTARFQHDVETGDLDPDVLE